jgi:elongation factor G
MGELHLEIIVDRLLREFKVAANVGNPQVAYKETIEARGRAEGLFDQQAVTKSQYGHVWLEIAPLARGEGFEFENRIPAENIPAEFIPAIEKGITDSLDSGVLIGFPTTDVRVSLVDGSYHEENSSEQAFGVAAVMAFRKVLEQAKPILLEPLMELEIVLPEASLGDVVADLNAKRAKIMGMDVRQGGLQVVTAQVPLAEMFGYSTDLRSATQGRASFSMHFASYDRVPDKIAEKVIKRIKGF